MSVRIAVFLLVIAPSLVVAQDEVEGPWGTIDKDLAATASSDVIPYLADRGPMGIAWSLDVRAAGEDGVAAANPMTFDADGNLYWKTGTGGGTRGRSRVVSVNPAGEIRWHSNNGAGTVFDLGSFYDGTAVIVGTNAVYALGATNGTAPLFIAAFDKATGATLWVATLNESAAVAWGFPSYPGLLTPVLYQGRLYVVTPDVETSLIRNVYQINAADGRLEWYRKIEGIPYLVKGAMTLVPDAFGNGEHGLYFNGDSNFFGTTADTLDDVFAIRITSDGADVAWSALGGKVVRSHLIYSAETKLLYATTWNDYGSHTMWTYDPVNGLMREQGNVAGNTGHGYYDVACLDFNGTDIIAGGFQGIVVRYTETGGPSMDSTIAFEQSDPPGCPFWGEYRTYGQLLKAPNGHNVLITGTNSVTTWLPGLCWDPSYTARVVAIDVTASPGELLWEFDTGIAFDHNYTVPGGPYAGPDGKVYYFHGTTGQLVALSRLPAASFTANPLGGKAPLEVTFDASASAGQAPIASYAWDFGDGTTGSGVTATHTFANQGDYVVILVVTDTYGLVGPIASATVSVGPPDMSFKRGDANDDGNSDIADAVFLLNYLFASGRDPHCLDTADVNDNGTVNIDDPVYLLSVLFDVKDSPPPPAPPFDQCGLDQSPQSPPVGCERYDHCQ
jgi:PKD repeat protein